MAGTEGPEAMEEERVAVVRAVVSAAEVMAVVGTEAEVMAAVGMEAEGAGGLEVALMAVARVEAHIDSILWDAETGNG